ncbi:MAG: DNA repair exonuclease [Candidatus Micrarchaeia archaeon]
MVSDLHIGYERFIDDAYAQAKEALEKASAMADVILLPGDIFDKRAPKPDVIAQAINLFRELAVKSWNARVVEFKSYGDSKAYTNLPIIAIPGTHERTVEGKENVLNLLALAKLMVDVSEATAIIELDGERIAITGLGGISDERAKEYLKNKNFKPVENMFNIFVFHQTIYEILPFDEHAIHYNDLPEGFDLYVDGHIHNRVENTVHSKPFLIPGSTVLTQLKDSEQEKKGFILFDTSNSTYEFIEINSRDFVVLNLKFDNVKPDIFIKECENQIERILNEHKGAIIKVKLEGTIAQGYNLIDMPIRSIMAKYEGKAIIEFDTSKFKSIESERRIDELKQGNIDGMPIKELGAKIFVNNLKEQKYNLEIDAIKLFEILGSGESKEKVIKKASEFIENEHL